MRRTQIMGFALAHGARSGFRGRSILAVCGIALSVLSGCGSESSLAVELIAPARVTVVQRLTAEGAPTAIVEWTAVERADLSAYVVYRAAEPLAVANDGIDAPSVVAETVSGGTLRHVEPVTRGTSYTYRVAIKIRDGRTGPLSEPAILRTAELPFANDDTKDTSEDCPSEAAFAPITSIDLTPPSSGNDARPVFHFSSDQADTTFLCHLDDGAWEPCTTPYRAPLQADGTHSFYVKAVNCAGLEDPIASRYDFLVDASEPAVSIRPIFGYTFGDIVYVDPGSQPLEFQLETNETGVSFMCGVAISTGGSPQVAPCTSPVTIQPGTLSDDTGYEIVVWATDSVGNQSQEAKRTFFIDTTAPIAAIDSIPKPFSNSLQAVFVAATKDFGITAAPLRYCRIYPKGSTPPPFGVCPTKTSTFDNKRKMTVESHEFTVQGDATYTWEFYTQDRAYDPSTCPPDAGEVCHRTDTYMYDFTIDTMPPVLTLQGPGLNTADGSPTILISADEALSAADCRLNEGGAYPNCAPQYFPFSPTEQVHILEVSAKDLAGNIGTASLTWTLDLTPPIATIDTAPPPLTDDPVATFTFSTSEAGASFLCDTGDGPAACSSPFVVSVATIAVNTLSLWAVDPAGNIQPISTDYSWRYAPFVDLTLDTTPPLLDSNPTPVFVAFGVGHSGFDCQIDGGAPYPCPTEDSSTGPVANFSVGPLSNGVHTMSVTAIGLGGLTASDTWTWEVDVSPPGGTSIALSPSAAAVTDDVSLGIQLTATDPHGPVEMRFSGDIQGAGGWLPLAAAATVTLNPAIDERVPDRNVYVEFRDGLGNVSSPELLTVQLDQYPPYLTLLSPQQGTIGLPTVVTGQVFESIATPAIVEVSILQQASNKHWSGTAYDSSAVVYTPAAVASSNWSWTIPASPSGAYTVEVHAIDTVGNSTFLSGISYTIDADPPACLATPCVRIASPSYPMVTTTAVDLLTFAASDAIEMRVTGDITDSFAGTWIGYSSPLSIHLNPPMTGTRTVSAEFRDVRQNKSAVHSDVVAFGVDTTAPSVAIDWPTVGSYHTQSLTVAGTAADAESWIGSVDVALYDGAKYFDGTSFSTITTIWLKATGASSWTWSLPSSLPPGNYFVTARATDASGNIGYFGSFKSFYWNQSPPASLRGAEGGIEIAWPAVHGAQQYKVHWDTDISGLPYDGWTGVYPSASTISTAATHARLFGVPSSSTVWAAVEAIGSVSLGLGAEGSGSVLATPTVQTFLGTETGAGYGRHANAGDVDGDGVPDTLFASPLSDVGGADAGSVGYLKGGALSSSPMTDGAAADELGAALAAAPDLDGDGVGDFFAGSPGDAPAGITSGAVYAGWATGASPVVRRWIGGTQAGERFGAALASGSDIDGDGLLDVVIGAPRRDAGPATDAGAVFVYTAATGSIIASLAGSAGSEHVGEALALADDLDSDGNAEILVGAPGAGGGAGTVTAYKFVAGNLVTLRTHSGGAGGDRFGAAIANLGDTNLDGVEEYAVGAPGTAGGGTVYVYDGATGLLQTTILSPAVGAKFGFSLSGGGDADGDGIPDIAVGAPERDASAGWAGVYSIVGQGRLIWGIGGGSAGNRFGSTVGLADTDNNGRVELTAQAADADGYAAQSGTWAVVKGNLLGASPAYARTTASTGTPLAVTGGNPPYSAAFVANRNASGLSTTLYTSGAGSQSDQLRISDSAGRSVDLRMDLGAPAVPGRVAALSATALDRTTIRLNWQDVLPSSSGYAIEYRHALETWQAGPVAGIGQLQADVTNLIAQTTYTLRVRSLGADVDAQASMPVTATTLP